MAQGSVDAVDPYIVRFSSLTCTMYVARQRWFSIVGATDFRVIYHLVVLNTSSWHQAIWTAGLSSLEVLKMASLRKSSPIHVRGLVQTSVWVSHGVLWRAFKQILSRTLVSGSSM